MADSDSVMLARAARAKRILEDPELQAAFVAVKASILERIEACPIRDKEGLYCLRLELKILQDVKANIQHVVNNGVVVTHRISLLERAKRVVSG